MLFRSVARDVGAEIGLVERFGRAGLRRDELEIAPLGLGDPNDRLSRSLGAEQPETERNRGRAFSRERCSCVPDRCHVAMPSILFSQQMAQVYRANLKTI